MLRKVLTAISRSSSVGIVGVFLMLVQVDVAHGSGHCKCQYPPCQNYSMDSPDNPKASQYCREHSREDEDRYYAKEREKKEKRAEMLAPYINQAKAISEHKRLAKEAAQQRIVDERDENARLLAQERTKNQRLASELAKVADAKAADAERERETQRDENALWLAEEQINNQRLASELADKHDKHQFSAELAVKEDLLSRERAKNDRLSQKLSAQKKKFKSELKRKRSSPSLEESKPWTTKAWELMTNPRAIIPAAIAAVGGLWWCYSEPRKSTADAKDDATKSSENILLGGIAGLGLGVVWNYFRSSKTTTFADDSSSYEYHQYRGNGKTKTNVSTGSQTTKIIWIVCLVLLLVACAIAICFCSQKSPDDELYRLEAGLNKR